jgi:hypothetical protein
MPLQSKCCRKILNPMPLLSWLTVSSRRNLTQKHTCCRGLGALDVLMKHKRRKMDKQKMDVGDESLMPKNSIVSGTQTE